MAVRNIVNNLYLIQSLTSKLKPVCRFAPINGVTEIVYFHGKLPASQTRAKPKQFRPDYQTKGLCSSAIPHCEKRKSDTSNLAMGKTTPILVDGPTLHECSTAQKALAWWTATFLEQGIPESRVSAEFLVAHALGFKKLHELTPAELENSLTQSQLTTISSLCNRKINREPLQYIVGEWDFRGVTLVVRQPVLIPRPETEMLVDVVIGHYQRLDEKLHLLEIGCGSGAIAVSILSELPKAKVTAIDCSADAVQLTMENAQRLSVSDRLTVHCGEITCTVPECLQTIPANTFDAIVSNPPYISMNDMQELAPEILLYEDHDALCGGSEGMDLIKDILRCARHLLKPGGSIWLETDTKHPEAIQQWLRANQETCVEFIRTYQDYSHRPRFSQLRYLQP